MREISLTFELTANLVFDMGLLISYLNDFAELFYPRLCVVCGDKLLRAEKYICLKCFLHMPRTNYHIKKDNLMEQAFYGRVPVERASAWIEFKKGSNYQNILHELKYRGQKELGEYLGERFAAEICHISDFTLPDLLCPVPLHPKRERKRGYNQSYHIALGLSRQLNIPVSKNNIIRAVHSTTQTNKSRYERWENMQGIFEVINPSLFDGKHIIIVDDVITTGSTLEACITAILSSCNARVSILTLAIA